MPLRSAGTGLPLFWGNDHPQAAHRERHPTKKVVRVQAWGSDFEKLAEQVWSMMTEMEGRNYFRSHAPHSWRPRLNVYETPQQYVVCVELSGMPREEIDVHAAGGLLHVSGYRQKPALPDVFGGGSEADEAEEAERVSVHLMEIDSGRFHRKLPIPTDVAVARITATYRQGYLYVVLPRAAEVNGVERA